MTRHRLLTCDTCDHIWTASSDPPDHPVHCPRCGAHVCACGCGANLGDQRSTARYKARSCYMSLARAGGETPRAVSAHISRTRDRVGARGGDVRSVQEARGIQEEEPEKARWTLIVREQIARTLLDTGYFHADDVDPLGVPEQHCNIIGSQIASFKNRQLMEPTGAVRKVTHRAANSRKAPIYRITAKGRKELTVGVGSDNREGNSGLRIPEPSTGRSESAGARSSLTADPGSQPGPETPVGSGASEETAPESDRLFEPEPERPRSAFTDREAA